MIVQHSQSPRSPDERCPQVFALKARIRRLHRLVDALPVLVSYVDSRQRYQFNNISYQHWFQVSKNELRGQHLSQALGKKAYEAIRPYVEQALAGKAVHFESRVPYRKAGLRYVSVNYIPDLQPSGAVEGFFALIQDISERKETQERLGRSEANMRQAQAIARLGSFDVWHPPSEKDFWSEELFNIFGIPPVDGPVPPGLAIRKLIHPEDRELVTKEYRRITQKPRRFELPPHRIIQPNGKIVFIQTIGESFVYPDTNSCRIVGVIQDITESHISKVNERRLQATVQASDEALITVELDGTISSWNKGAEHMLGYSSGEMIGKPIRLLRLPLATSPARLISSSRHLRDLDREKEVSLLRKDRTRLIVALSVNPVKDLDAKIIGFAITARDVTETRRLQAEVLKASDRERQRLAQELHDGLGQGLAGLAYICEGLAHELEGRPGGKKIARVETLIRGLTSDARKMARGILGVEDRPEGLMDALQGMVAYLAHIYPLKISLHCPKPILLHDVRTANHLFRIAQEATKNSVTHGKCEVIEISLIRKSSRIHLLIRDDGAGFARPKLTGNGMGLGTMQYRAQILGGKIQIKSAPGLGTEVQCVVPLNAVPFF